MVALSFLEDSPGAGFMCAEALPAGEVPQSAPGLLDPRPPGRQGTADGFPGAVL